MVELADLEINVLEFLHKSFAFARVAEWDGRELAVFQRTETEDETKFRPKILRLWLVVPRDWVLYDLAADLLVLGADGRTPGPRAAGTAIEAAAETSEFREQGIPFQRVPVDGGWAYLPTALGGELRSAHGLAALGLAAPASR